MNSSAQEENYNLLHNPVQAAEMTLSQPQQENSEAKAKLEPPVGEVVGHSQNESTGLSNRAYES